MILRRALVTLAILPCLQAFAATQTTLTALSGGQASVRATDHRAFSRPSANMPLMKRLDFSVGHSFFRNPWVAAPASTDARDGLGPLFNTNACQNCHIRDGRGHAPAANGDQVVSMLVRLSIDSDQPLPPFLPNHPEPNYGSQLQDFALPGFQPEARVNIRYISHWITLDDGEQVELRRPQLELSDPAYGELHPDLRTSARIAPPMIGLGLLEAIPATQLEAAADPTDRDGDGISGRINLVWDQSKQRLVPGRFGWKAAQPNLRQQNAAAFHGDMGITSDLFVAENCTEAQLPCGSQTTGTAPNKSGSQETDASQSADTVPEISSHLLDQVTFYTRNLAVPTRRNPDHPQVQRGEKLFKEFGCHQCHISRQRTAPDYELSWLADQTIFPYTDLLLHDMGEGLADQSREFVANGSEWRTPPLWGIGLTFTVGGVESYLHDGRARNLQEAILWHGGEAQKSRDAYKAAPKDQRRALLQFLQDL
ncbi:thiol oxidoreductase [Pseudomaricurvus alkylphenolicus]|jgi:CxxC motif-containing protein (DUF1111 family)|uniref:di-heme oxidoreductase family protein n=1 Tax=Pseudomaricurvus alkylphenolicus TaxID=1306991 RepID=UPI0014214CE0|nr:di-heme oxidoredictase family protein [Pseudomaricurvus alkylphenolicus]NIB39899.1 thiol oxidoreductase [Pseudomaricurvus alkylphenolicus]